MPLELEMLTGFLLGLGLSAACGFRVFIPPLVLSAAAVYFNLPLPEGMAWLGTDMAFFVLLTATLLEVGAYYVPWLDNALDTVATPMSVIAGTLLTAPFLGDMDPVLKWTLALVAGGGAAGAVQSVTNVSRLTSTATTGGLANPVIATIENILSLILAVIAVVFPILAVVVMVVLALVASRLAMWIWQKRRPLEPGQTAS